MYILPLVLWCCWLGVRKSIRPAEIWVMLPPNHLLFIKIQNGLTFWCWLIQLVLEKRPLNGCLSVIIFTDTAWFWRDVFCLRLLRLLAVLVYYMCETCLWPGRFMMTSVLDHLACTVNHRRPMPSFLLARFRDFCFHSLNTDSDNTTPPPQPFYGPFPGPPRWAGARRELLDFMVQGKINRGRHTDHPTLCQSIWTNQCPPPLSPHIFYRILCTYMYIHC